MAAGGVLFSWVAVVLAAMPSAQNPAVSQNPSLASEGSLGRIAANGAIVAELVSSVDAKKARTDAKIAGRLTMDVLAHGEIVIPRGTKIIGHVTDARARTKQIPQSTVEIVFDRIVLKSGREIPLKATIQAVGSPRLTSTPGNDDISDLDLARQTASRPAPGPNERMSIAETTYPGSRRPADAVGGSEEPTDSGGPPRPLTSLGPSSQGVIGMKGITLRNSAQGSAISSSSGNVHLNSGTQLVLHVTEPQALTDSLRKTRN
jgi:hypothetical protein